MGVDQNAQMLRVHITNILLTACFDFLDFMSRLLIFQDEPFSLKGLL